MKTLLMEWRYTYRSARRDGDSRALATRKFLREVSSGWKLSMGLHPRYHRNGSQRR